MTVQQLITHLQNWPITAEVRIKDVNDSSGAFPKGHPVSAVNYHPPQSPDPQWISIDMDSTQP